MTPTLDHEQRARNLLPLSVWRMGCYSYEDLISNITHALADTEAQAQCTLIKEFDGLASTYASAALDATTHDEILALSSKSIAVYECKDIIGRRQRGEGKP